MGTVEEAASIASHDSEVSISGKYSSIFFSLSLFLRLPSLYIWKVEGYYGHGILIWKICFDLIICYFILGFLFDGNTCTRKKGKFYEGLEAVDWLMCVNEVICYGQEKGFDSLAVLLVNFKRTWEHDY